MAALPEARRFEAYDPASGPLKEMPLLVGITGPSFSGKSWSAERIAAGIQKIYGGKIYHIDTENDRALELHPRYGVKFNFQHVPFRSPKSPEEYEKVIRFCLAKPDCGVIIVDTMTHEHLALLNMMEEYMERKGAGDDWQKREKLIFASMVVPKAQRKRLNELIAFGCIRSDGQKVPILLLYRAQDKTKPGKSKSDGGDGKPIHKGWQAETTSDLPFYMTARFLLPPASDGHPNLIPDTEWERREIKNPQQFREWFKPGFQLNEEIGERLARWAKGETPAPQAVARAEAPAPAGKADARQPVSFANAVAAGLLAQASRDELIDRLRAALKPIRSKEERADLCQRHFLRNAWAEVLKLPPPALAAGLESLERELAGLAAMQQEPDPPDPQAEPEPELDTRQPGEDD